MISKTDIEELQRTEPARLDAQAAMWSAMHASANHKEQFRLAVLISEARKAASELRAMRSARLRLTYSQGY